MTHVLAATRHVDWWRLLLAVLVKAGKEHVVKHGCEWSCNEHEVTMSSKGHHKLSRGLIKFVNIYTCTHLSTGRVTVKREGWSGGGDERGWMERIKD